MMLQSQKLLYKSQQLSLTLQYSDCACAVNRKTKYFEARTGSSTCRYHTIRRSAAQRVSSVRFDNCSLRSTELTWVSTVLTEMNSSAATSLYV